MDMVIDQMWIAFFELLLGTVIVTGVLYKLFGKNLVFKMWIRIFPSIFPHMHLELTPLRLY